MSKKNKKLNSSDIIEYNNLIKPGLSVELIKNISKSNNEPDWMLNHRLKSYEIFLKKDLPKWGPDLSDLDLESIYYFAQPAGAENSNIWNDMPENIKSRFKEIGVSHEKESNFSGVGAQFDSEAVYHGLKEEYQKMGIIFEDMKVAILKYPDLVKKYFSKCITFADHKFSSLHYAVWSGGTFLYIPAGVKLTEPIQSYFRMNIKGGGQFEHTLIILEDNSEAHYIEGCSAPKYDKRSLHAGGVEIFVGKNSIMRYSSVENWSMDTYNLNTKRAIVKEGAHIEWVSGNLGSGISMLYPCSVLLGDNSSSEHLGVSMAAAGQVQDLGAKVIHIGKNTTSNILSKSISKGGGIGIYRGLIDIKSSGIGAVSKVDCDALLYDDISVSETIPSIVVGNPYSSVGHEASAGKIDENKIFYLQSKGISEERAKSMIVNGFLNDIIKELPLEYATEMNVLISMEMEGSF